MSSQAQPGSQAAGAGAPAAASSKSPSAGQIPFEVFANELLERLQRVPQKDRRKVRGAGHGAPRREVWGVGKRAGDGGKDAGLLRAWRVVNE